MENKFIEQIKSFRVTIDGLSKRAYFTRQIVSEELKMSKAWLGMIFSVCGLELTSQFSLERLIFWSTLSKRMDPIPLVDTVFEIPDITDVSDCVIKDVEFNNDFQYIETIYELRTEISTLFEEMQIFEAKLFKVYTNKVEACYKQSWKHLTNASMQLGFELSRLAGLSHARLS